MIKNILKIPLFFSALGAGLTVMAVGVNMYTRSPQVTVSQSEYLTEITATSTIKGAPKREVQSIDSSFAQQGICLMIKDVDGAGYTYLTVNNGTGTFSSVSCE